jgi:hypothetical protein
VENSKKDNEKNSSSDKSLNNSSDDENVARKIIEKALGRFEDARQVDWCSLPHEIWLNILIHLNQNELAQFGRTCKMFNQIYSDRIFCKYL